jgi:hypothetical protein
MLMLYLCHRMRFIYASVDHFIRKHRFIAIRKLKTTEENRTPTLESCSVTKSTRNHDTIMFVRLSMAHGYVYFVQCDMFAEL